jgi:hypothetical protein
MHRKRADAVFLILTRLSFPVQSLVALPSHFPDGGAGLTDRDPSLSFPLGWGFPVGGLEIA